MSYLLIRRLAVPIAVVIVCILFLPDYAFFPLVGAAALLGGFLILENYPVLGPSLMIGGGAMLMYGGYTLLQRRREQDEEARKTEEDARRWSKFRM